MSVFVSGATGYIAQHIVSQLLEQDYKVIGAARNQEKANNMLNNFNNDKLSMVVVGDITNLNAFDEAFKVLGKEIKYVIHAASPVVFDVTDYEKDILIPAVNGTKGILESIKKYAADTVERVVVTSSIAAMSTYPETLDPKIFLNEESWNNYTWENCQGNGASAYFGSKKFAEKELWKFIEENKDVIKLKATTINPTFVFGPQALDADVKPKLNLSAEIVNCMIHTTPDSEIGPLSDKFIDVRDVAKAHILAFQKEELADKRLILSEDNYSNYDILKYLNNDFSVLKNKIAAGNLSMTVEGKKPTGCVIDNSKTKKLLGFKFRTLQQSVDDATTQILKHEGRL